MCPLPMGSSELIPYFVLLVQVAVALPTNCLYLNPRVLSLSPFRFSPRTHCGEWASGCVGLSCLLGLTRSKYSHFKYSGVNESLSSR